MLFFNNHFVVEKARGRTINGIGDKTDMRSRNMLEQKRRQNVKGGEET